jgi:hypothetical protein
MGYPLEELSAVAEAVERLGSQKKAAKELGLSRRAVQRRLYAYRDNGSEFLQKQADQHGFDPEDVNHYWVKTKEGSFHVTKDTEIDYNQLREDFLSEAAEYAPKYSDNSINYNKNVLENNLLVIDIADIHFGKLSLIEETSQEYDLEIAALRMREGVSKLLNKAKVHGIDRIVFVLGNDALHVDNPFRKTTAGTPQDTDSQWWNAYKVAKNAYIAAIEELALVAPVHLVFNPSNHDYQSGWMLADSVSSWFARHPNVETKDGSLSIAHRKYVQYGQNLLGFTHGDGAKEGDLPSLMQYEARQSWGETKFAYWHCHHFHVKDRKIYGKQNYRIEKDHIGVTVLNSGRERDPTNSVFVEIVRSPSSADSWHNRNGHVGKAAVECFMYSENNGQIARFTHYF